MSARGEHRATVSKLKSQLAGEEQWLGVLALMTLAEFGLWALCWHAGMTPAPRIGPYAVLSVAALAAALALRTAFRRGSAHASWPALLLGTLLIAVGASLFLPIKYAIPKIVPFWLDLPLAAGERQPFGTDPWRIADRLLGWALLPADRVYALWLPVQSIALFSVMLLRPSPEKSRALIAYSLAWFVLGVVAALLFASAGPIFYDRLFGGDRFGALTHRLAGRAWMTEAESNAMWASFASGRPGLVAGISAMPSLHVAITVWIWLTARSLAPAAAPIALAYVVFMWIASVQLGWHYVSDGLVGALGMGALWWLSQKFTGAPSTRATPPSDLIGVAAEGEASAVQANSPAPL